MVDDGAFDAWSDDRPWDEYEWEAFLQEQDRQTERYIELEEQYRGLPDAEERIARDMGWELSAAFDPDAADADGLPGSAWRSDEQLDDAGEPAPLSYEADPLWRRAHSVAVQLHRHLRVAADGAGSPGPPELLTQVAMIAAKIAGGRSMGFSRDALGGNIANHKRAMSHTLLTLSALDEAERSDALPRAAAARFRRDLLGMRERLMDRIVELRDMFASGRFLDE
jgi:hypothetical protein